VSVILLGKLGKRVDGFTFAPCVDYSCRLQDVDLSIFYRVRLCGKGEGLRSIKVEVFTLDGFE